MIILGEYKIVNFKDKQECKMAGAALDKTPCNDL